MPFRGSPRELIRRVSQCTDFCDSTPADTECGHACLEGYVGGMVRCVGGAYEVTPCYVACANWETSQASAVWGEVHMQPLGLDP